MIHHYLTPEEIQHLNVLHTLNACTQCHSHKMINGVVKCDLYPGMDNNIACININKIKVFKVKDLSSF